MYHHTKTTSLYRLFPGALSHVAMASSAVKVHDIYIYIYIYWGVWYSVDTDYNVIIVTRCQKDIWQNEQTTQADNINKWQRCGWPWLGSLCAPSETLIR